MEKQERIFQSVTTIPSVSKDSSSFSLGSQGDENLSVSLALFSSLAEEELNTRARELLHPGELNEGNGYGSGIRRSSFFHGRVAAKMAVGQIFPEYRMTVIRVATGSFGAPYLSNLGHPYGISIAHGDVWNTGLCFPLSVPMGIDAETISGKNHAIIPSILSDEEKEMTAREENPLEFLHLLWTAKEAAGKAIGLGFRVPAGWYEIDSVDTFSNKTSLIRRCRFKKLSLFTALSVSIPEGILSIAFPAGRDLEQPMTRLFEKLSEFQTTWTRQD